MKNFIEITATQLGADNRASSLRCSLEMPLVLDFSQRFQAMLEEKGITDYPGSPEFKIHVSGLGQKHEFTIHLPANLFVGEIGLALNRLNLEIVRAQMAN